MHDDMRHRRYRSALAGQALMIQWVRGSHVEMMARDPGDQRIFYYLTVTAKPEATIENGVRIEDLAPLCHSIYVSARTYVNGRLESLGDAEILDRDGLADPVDTKVVFFDFTRRTA